MTAACPDVKFQFAQEYHQLPRPTAGRRSSTKFTSKQSSSDPPSFNPSSPGLGNASAPPSAPPSAPLSTRGSLLSIATLARDRTASAITTLASKATGGSSSLRSSSSVGSLRKQGSTATTPASSPLKKLPGKSSEQNSTTPPGSRSQAEDPFATPPSSRPSSLVPSPSSTGAPNSSKMHQTSSRLLRMTDEERPFTRIRKRLWPLYLLLERTLYLLLLPDMSTTLHIVGLTSDEMKLKDFKDLFSTLMVSLPLSAHRVRFRNVDFTFTSEEAINNLGSLKFSQSNRMPDPKDPSRIVTTTTTTTFSMAREMARSVCQRFMDARFIEPADLKPVTLFPLKHAIWQLTPKGINVLQHFCQRNGITQPHVMNLVASNRNTMQLVTLERDSTTDKLSHDRATIEVIFRRFVGQDGPNVTLSASSSDSDSINDYYNGLVGVKMVKDRKISDRTVHNTFTGKAAVDWLVDCCTTVDKREAYEIGSSFMQLGLIYCVLEDKAYAQQRSSEANFQPTRQALYALTEKGQRLAGWVSRDKPFDASGSGKAGSGSSRADVPRETNTTRLTVILSDAALRLLFREHLRDTHCEENLSFYLDVVEFTSTFRAIARRNELPKIDTVRETLAAAYGLYNAFLAPGSPCELNIDHQLRNSLASRMTRAVGDDQGMITSLKEVADLFDEAQNQVFKLMASDSVPKFLKEPRYAAVLREHDFENAVASSQYTPHAAPERTMSKLARYTGSRER